MGDLLISEEKEGKKKGAYSDGELIVLHKGRRLDLKIHLVESMLIQAFPDPLLMSFVQSLAG